MITPTFNSASTIERTINSVLSQNYPNLEYIIVDGASKDDTLKIVNKYKDKIACIISEPDHGISDAFNKGIKRATGDLIGIINSDDYLLPGALKTLNDVFDGQTDIYRGNIILKDPTTGFECIEKPSMHFPTMPFFIHVSHQGTFITREAYNKIGLYDESIRWSMDLDLLMRADKQHARFKHVDTPLAVFVAGGFTSANISKKKKDFLRLIEKNGGTKLQAHLFYDYVALTQYAKHMLNKISPNLGQALRYKKTKE